MEIKGNFDPDEWRKQGRQTLTGADVHVLHAAPVICPICNVNVANFVVVIQVGNNSPFITKEGQYCEGCANKRAEDVRSLLPEKYLGAVR